MIEPETPRVPPQLLLEPTPMMQLLREERIASATRRPTRDRSGNETVLRWQAQGRPVTPVAEDDEDEPQTDTADAPPEEPAPEEVEYAEGEVRKIVVRRHRFATYEDLIRAAIRNVEARRPRELYANRLLLRFSGPICNCDGDAQEQARARAVSRELVRRARLGMKACLSDALADDPRVLAKAPALLVVSQAMRSGPLVWRFAPTIDIGPTGVEWRALGWIGDGLTEELSDCLVKAMKDARPNDTSMLTLTHHVQLPLVAFSQQGMSHATAGSNAGVAMQAAQLGWLHYERGEFDLALGYFQDAHWGFHLAEYDYLVGLAYERLGQAERAAAAYERYLVKRPYAPEVIDLPDRIDALRKPGA